jgi:hypothetical protein
LPDREPRRWQQPIFEGGASKAGLAIALFDRHAGSAADLGVSLPQYFADVDFTNSVIDRRA